MGMMKVRVLVRCPLCGLSSSAERLKRGPFELGMITKWATSRGRGTIQNHYAPLPESPGGRSLKLGVLKHLERILVLALESVRAMCSALRQSPECLTAPSASVIAVPSFELIPRDSATLISTLASALTRFERRSSGLLVTVPVRILD